MRVSERICEEVKDLPELLQVEVLDYVQFLASRLEREGVKDEQALRILSLSLALRGMEHEESPSYSMTDLREKFR